MEQIDGWLKCENLKGFLVALSEIVGYRFGDLDWGAFEAGLQDSACDDDWFTYPLAGRMVVEIAVSRTVEEGEISVKVYVPEERLCLRERIEVAWMVFNRFDISADVELMD